MSGWFGTSNRDTNTPLSGIAAGHAARRRMQKQRYNPMGRMTIDQMAEKSRSKPAVTLVAGGDKQAYKTFTLTSTFNSGLNKWVTSGRKGLKTFNATGRSKGQSVNAVKNKIDASLGQDKNKMTMFTDASSESIREVTIPKTDPGEVARFNRVKAQEEARKMFTPVTMPRDFTTGRYTVRAMYNGMSKKYTVSVFEGTVVKEVATFTQDQGAAAVVKHTQLKSLATKKTVYEGKKPLSVAKTNYDVKLQVTSAAAGLSGFFNGVMSMFGLGSASEAARFQRRADSGIDRQRVTQAQAQSKINQQKVLKDLTNRAKVRARTPRKKSPMDIFKQASNTSVSELPQARIANRDLDRGNNYRDAILRDYGKPTPTFEEASRASVTTDYTSASNRPEVSAKWSEMPAKSFKVITSRKDGTVVKESGSTSDYLRAVDMFQAEVATIENTPDFYDQDAPPVLDVPRATGDGGDITSQMPATNWTAENRLQPPAGFRFFAAAPMSYKGYFLQSRFYRPTAVGSGLLPSTGLSASTRKVPKILQIVEVFSMGPDGGEGNRLFQTFTSEFDRQTPRNMLPRLSEQDPAGASYTAKAWVDANPLFQNEVSVYRDPIMIAADEKKKRDAAKAKLAEADRFKRRKEQQVAKAAQAKAAAAKAKADKEAARDYLRQEAARAAEEKAAADARAAEQKASEAAAAEAQAKADALKFLQQDASVVTTDTTTVYQDPIITQAQTGSENYNELVNAGEDTTTFYQDPIIRQAQTYVAQNYEANPYVIQQATADITPVAPAATHSHLGLALVGLAGLAYVANRE
jgi:hypothetical protein